MENQARSDFFIDRVKVGFMYEVASSCCTEINSGVTRHPY